MILDNFIAVSKKWFAFFRKFRPSLLDLAKIAQNRHQWDIAISLLEKAIVRYPKNINAHIQYGTVLTQMGRYSEAEAIFREAAARWPNSKKPLVKLAHLAYAQRDYEQSCTRYRDVFERFPDDLALRSAYIRSLLNVLKFDEAHKLYNETAKYAQDPMFLSILSDIHAAEYNFPAALKVIQSIFEAAPENVNVLNKKIKLLIQSALNTIRSEHLKQAIEILEELEQKQPRDFKRSLQLAKAYISAHKDKEAIPIIHNIPNSFDNHKEVMQLRAWQYHQYGDDAKSKKIWAALQERHYIRELHSPIVNLKRMDNRTMKTKPDEILLFSAVRNELMRIRWFLDYYRKIGVNHFFIIDNDSDDGTYEFLLKQKDVFTFWTNDDFSKAGQGIRWINELVEQFGRDKWCLYVDADEALVYPGMEKTGLHHLTAYMKRKGHEALSAFMLDMYHSDMQLKTNDHCDSNFTSEYPYFYNRYHTYGITNCPYKQIVGGIRYQLFKFSDNQTKTPIIRGGEKIKFLTSSHQITPAIVSDVTAVLQHYKLAGDFHTYCQKAISMNGWSSGCKRRHFYYSKKLSDLGHDDFPINEFTERFESTKQLLDLGIINCPNDFLVPK